MIYCGRTRVWLERRLSTREGFATECGTLSARPVLGAVDIQSVQIYDEWIRTDELVPRKHRYVLSMSRGL